MADRKAAIINWFIVENMLTPRRGCLTEVCLCEEREEGERICPECWPEARAWQQWMAEVPADG
jgi:hypothetical protein